MVKFKEKDERLRAREYSNRKKISRLFKAFKSGACSIVCTLLSTSRDVDVIIQTLNLHYGNKWVVAEKIVKSLKTLPSVSVNASSLTQFATER